MWLVDLSSQDEEDFPTTMLSFPRFSPQSQLNTRIISAYFFSGSCSAGPDIYQANQRAGETNVVTVLFLAETFVEGSLDDSLESQFLLFISRKHLLQLATTRPHVDDIVVNKYGFKEINPFGGPPPVKLPYNTWGKSGTRWLNSTRISAYNDSSSYGSRFVCVADPQQFGINPPRSQIQMDTSSENGQSFNTQVSPAVCLLEFNERLWGSETSDPSVVREREEVDELLATLDTDVKGGMPFRVKTFQQSGSDRWYSVMIDRDHMVTALVSTRLLVFSPSSYASSNRLLLLP